MIVAIYNYLDCAENCAIFGPAEEFNWFAG